jgi:regulator of replication initiation timing
MKDEENPDDHPVMKRIREVKNTIEPCYRQLCEMEKELRDLVGEANELRYEKLYGERY